MKHYCSYQGQALNIQTAFLGLWGSVRQKTNDVFFNENFKKMVVIFLRKISRVVCHNLAELAILKSP